MTKLVSPNFISINYTKFSKNYLKINNLKNKHILVIKDFNEDGSIKEYIINANVDKDGHLCIGTAPAALLPGDYYFFVSNNEIKDIDKIKKIHCTHCIEIPEEYDKLIDIPYAYRDLGSDSKGNTMLARVYGSGQDIAIFFIGGLHGNEYPGIWSIYMMEQYIEQNPQLIPSNVQLFFLNPVHDLNQIERRSEELLLKNPIYRYINNLDPNREFFKETPLREVANIKSFTQTLYASFNNLIIISGHGANDDSDDRILGQGIILPNFKLNPSGKQKVADRLKNGGNYYNGLVLNRNDFINPIRSNNLALLFETETKYKHSPLWLNMIYEGEYMNYISTFNQDIIMIEFEAPMSLSSTLIESTFGVGYRNFINLLLGRYIASI